MQSSCNSFEEGGGGEIRLHELRSRSRVGEGGNTTHQTLYCKENKGLPWTCVETTMGYNFQDI